jgi:glycosyltransferase involved in cell wall biosynthesis
VTFHGYVSEDEKRSMLNRAEVFAFASEQEGFGVVMLEAMAAGLPVVARRLPVYEEFFQYGRNGYLVDEDNPEAFAECIASLLDDAAEREYIRDNNLRDSKEYSWERITSRIEDVFWEVSRESR